MKKKLTHIKVILEELLKNIRPEADIEMVKIWDIWDITVGEFIAKESKPGAFKNGTLIVHVSNSVWMYQLKFLKKEMIAKLNNKLNADMVKEIEFKIGNVHG